MTYQTRSTLFFTLVMWLGGHMSVNAQSYLPGIINLVLDPQGIDEVDPRAGQHLRISGSPDSGGFGYYLYFPRNYNASSTHKFPLILFLHGQGEMGNGSSQIDRVLRNGPPKMIQAGAHFPAIVVSPQLSSGTWTEQTTEVNVAADLDALLSTLIQSHNVDESRIYITGLSLGGGGAWNYARLYPNRVAAVVPVCGVGINRTNMASLQSIGVWAFHALGDTVVNSNASKQSMNAIAGTANNQSDGVMYEYPDDGNENVVSREANSWVWRRGRFNATGQLRYTVFPDNSHNAWSRAYNDNGLPNTVLWQWLFMQQRQSAL